MGENKVFENGKLPPQNQETFEKVYHDFMNNAHLIGGNEQPFTPASEIPWADPELMRKGQEFVRRNRFANIYAYVIAIFFTYPFKHVGGVVYREMRFHPTENSSFDNLKAEKTVRAWHETDLFDETSDGCKLTRIIRKAHEPYTRSNIANPNPAKTKDQLRTVKQATQLCEAVKEDLKDFDSSGAPPHVLNNGSHIDVSQMGIEMIHFTFFAHVLMFPEALGVREGDEDEYLPAYLHLMAIVGRQLGVLDRFNLALYPSKWLYRKVYDNIIISNMKILDPDMSYFISNNFSWTYKPMFGVKSMKVNSVWALQLEMAGLPSSNLKSIFTIGDRFNYHALRTVRYLARTNRFVRAFLNWLIHFLYSISFKLFLHKKEGAVPKSGLNRKNLPMANLINCPMY